MAHSSLLTALLPSTSYLLAYALSLLFPSLSLTFAGAFLTLDRTRSFSPDYDTVPGSLKKRKFGWLLEGGVGGLAAGCVFGIHLSTFLALLIPAISTSSALTPKSFLPVWLLSAIVTTVLSGRWKHFALAFSGISGGTLVALSLSVIVHPSLPTRIILTAIILPTLVIMTFLPLVRFQHAALRFALSVTGAFGIVLSIALLSRIQAWANVWERYWESDSFSWGTSKEKGLSVVFCLLFCAGMACDWSFRRVFGECPDEKWDHYLANYVANVPNRAGTFQPLHSFWDHPFGVQRAPLASKEIVSSCDKFDSSNLSLDVHSPFKLRKHGPSITRPATDITDALEFPNSSACLKKGRSLHPRCGRRKEAVKFDCVYSSDSDSHSEDSHVRLWLKKPSLTSRVSRRGLKGGVDYELQKARMAQIKGLDGGEVPDYSDFEEDVTVEKMHLGGDRDSFGHEWSPEFLRKHLSVTASSGTAVSFPPVSPLPSRAATPATPSALGRQQTAFDFDGSCLPSDPSRPKSTDALLKVSDVRDGEEYKGLQWDEFWKDVRDKARD